MGKINIYLAILLCLSLLSFDFLGYRTAFILTSIFMTLLIIYHFFKAPISQMTGIILFIVVSTFIYLEIKLIDAMLIKTYPHQTFCGQVERVYERFKGGQWFDVQNDKAEQKSFALHSDFSVKQGQNVCITYIYAPKWDKNERLIDVQAR